MISLIEEGVVSAFIEDLPQSALRQQFNWVIAPRVYLVIRVSQSERLSQFQRDHLEGWLGNYGSIKREIGYTYTLVVRTKRKWLPSLDFIRKRVAEIVESCAEPWVKA